MDLEDPELSEANSLLFLIVNCTENGRGRIRGRGLDESCGLIQGDSRGIMVSVYLGPFTLFT